MKLELNRLFPKIIIYTIFTFFLSACSESGDTDSKTSAVAPPSIQAVAKEEINENPIADSESVDWSKYGNNYANHRFSELNQITTKNVDQLELAWSYQTGIKKTFQTSPIVIDGVMFITTPLNDVISLNAENGQEVWRYRHDLKGDKFCCGPANRGPAVANGKVFTVTIDARLIALDQKTGEKLWDVPISDINLGIDEKMNPISNMEELKGAVMTGASGHSASLAPQVYDGKVFVGITGAGYGLHMEVEQDGEPTLAVGGFAGGGHGLRGFMMAYDVNTGKEIWRWYSASEEDWAGDWVEASSGGESFNRDIESEKANYEKYKDSWKLGGGSIWTTPALDTELGLLYFGTGNPSPQMEDSTRPGDSRNTVSLVAVDVNTGKLKWAYQQVPHDRWGYDVASPPVLIDFVKDGKTTKAVSQASKTGWLFVHDRATGELLMRSDAFVPQENIFARPVEEGVRIAPSTFGATTWSPAAYYPELNSMFIAGIYTAAKFYSKKLTPEPGKPWSSFTFFKPTTDPTWGNITSVDLTSGKIKWEVKTDQPMVGGVMATAGGLLFAGEGNGNFNAYEAKTGKQLWQYKSQYGVNAPPITYKSNGTQYIAVASGGSGLYKYAMGDEILVFRLKQ
jgi:glucose dehydrogenase